MTETADPAEQNSDLRNFLAALRTPHTYDPWNNRFALFGLVWGFPLSVFSLFIDSWVIGHPYRMRLFWEEPVHLVFLVHPLLFGMLFGAMGTTQRRQVRRIAELLGLQRKHVEELGRANDELRKLDVLKTQFMANVTHELKTPLVAIRGYNESILEGRFGPLTPKQKNGLTVAVRNVGRLEKLVLELLEFERIEAKAYAPKRTDVELAPLLHMVLSNFQPQIDEKRLAVSLSAPERVWVHADGEGIRRVLVNLLSNAVKFSPAGGTLGLSAVADLAAGTARLAVWDQGPGIAPEARPFLFTRFWQADGSSRRRHGGTGLGLAIVKGILDAHGAPIRIDSAPGQGTRIEFELPLIVPNPDVKERTSERGTAAHSGR